jgi:hypothetical protein
MSAAELASQLKGASDAVSQREIIASHRAKLQALRDSRREAHVTASANASELAVVKDKQKAAKDKQQQQQAASAQATTSTATKDEAVSKYASFIKERGALHAKLAKIREAFTYGAGIDESAVRAASLRSTFDACDAWLKDGFAEKLEDRLTALANTGKALETDGADVHDVTALRTLQKEVVELYKTNAARWHRESTRRRNRDKLVSDFDTDRTKLLHWCRQQVSMLSNITEPDHVQEFCASFYNNTAVMESNFLVLMEMSEALLPSPAVEAQLMELAEVWLGLETQAFEKLRATLLDLHAKSGIEAQTRLWPEFADRFQKFLVESIRVLNIPTDDESVAVAAPLKEAAKELQANLDAHRLIVAHLSDFALREECLREHYNAIHKAAFSKLTLMTQAFPGLYSYPRKSEYTDRMAELSDWVEAKSRGQAWKDLLARVDRMKRLIEDNELTLNDTEERY